MLNYLRLLLLAMIVCMPFQISAAEGDSYVKARLIQEEATIQPGRPFWVAVHLNLEKDWHVYWKNPGDAGIPLKVEWNLPPGFEATPLQWPFPEKFEVAEMVGFGYNGDVTLLAQVTPPAQFNSKEDILLKAEIKWLVCSAMTCQPGSASLDLPLKVSAERPQLRSDLAALFEHARAKIPHAQVEVKTVRKDGIVQLELPQEPQGLESETVREAFFFSEEKNVIDHTIDPTIDSSAQKSNHYFVNLKVVDQIGAGNKSLKGVLVLHKQKGMQDSVQAIDINSLIEDEDQQFLSFLDPSSLFVGKGDATLPASSPVFEGGLSVALLFAFLGGMILNLMPCVLPVISFKVMSFVKMAGQKRSLTIKHGLMFSFGVLFSFWVLATAMFLLRTYGQAVGWGFQLQEPLFVVILASVLFIFSLSLFGLFEWGMFLSSWAGQTQADASQKSSGYVGSFLSGVLATAVATPCTGPFLGSAVGFAVTLPFLQSLLIFTVLGLGMCFPYLLLAIFPSFLRFMPKPGPWMETFKQLMAFLLLATVLWLLWVFSAQTNTLSLIALLCGFLLFSIAAWIYGKGCSPVVSRKARGVSYLFVIAFALMGFEAILFPRSTWDSQVSLEASGGEWEGWEEFSPERVAQLQKEGKPVLIDFTAKWCLICQANHLVLNSDEVKKQLDERGVVRMKADWTKSNPVITKELSKFGRNSVPLYVFYAPGEEANPVILPQVLTTDVVLTHINQSANQRANQEIVLK